MVAPVAGPVEEADLDDELRDIAAVSELELVGVQDWNSPWEPDEI